MHIIFRSVNLWQVPILKILKYFNFKVFYIFVEEKKDFKKNEIAKNLKQKKILPLPLEFEKKISLTNKNSYNNPDEIVYELNTKLVPNRILKKFCELFFIEKNKEKKLRLLIYDFVWRKPGIVWRTLGLWSTLYPKTRIIYVSFKFSCFYMSDIDKKISKIVIPLDILNYFIKFIKKIIYLFKKKKDKKYIIIKDKFNNYDEVLKTKVAFVTHKGLLYNPGKEGLLYDKSLYYSSDSASSFNKKNILHIDYSGFLKPEEDIHWISLKKEKINEIKILLKTFLGSLKTIYLIRNWSSFLGWFLCIYQYNQYLKYYSVIRKFKNLKIAVIDNDSSCPKTLLLAFGKNNIKTISTQERFIRTYSQSYIDQTFFSVILDTYYVASEFSANIIKNSKNHYIKNIIPVGQNKCDYIALYKNSDAPEEIIKAKKEGKKILVALGHHTSNYWFESSIAFVNSWSAEINFLEDMIKLSKNLENTSIIIRYKTLDWSHNQYFKDILNKVQECKNIIISNNYNESYYSYKLCAHADLVVAKHTSLADECLSEDIPVIFYEYTHNMQKIKLLNGNNYLPSELICHNFEDLCHKSKSILHTNSSKLIEVVKKINNKIYYVKETKNVKQKILNDLENQLSVNKI